MEEAQILMDSVKPGNTPHRLEAFSDGVLAIAITLLVLDIKLPVVPTTASLAHPRVDGTPLPDNDIELYGDWLLLGQSSPFTQATSKGRSRFPAALVIVAVVGLFYPVPDGSAR